MKDCGLGDVHFLGANHAQNAGAASRVDAAAYNDCVDRDSWAVEVGLTLVPFSLEGAISSTVWMRVRGLSLCKGTIMTHVASTHVSLAILQVRHD